MFHNNVTTMSPTATIYHVLCFILIQIIFINIAIGSSQTAYNNATITASQWKSVRSKRTLHETMLYRLNIRIQYATGQEILLTWIKQTEHLANKYLPVITPPEYLNPNVMEDVGDFVVYHDIEKCSSVAYFEKLNAFFGNIGMDYAITSLPYKFDGTGNYVEVAGLPYVMRRDNTLLHNVPQLQDTYILPSFGGGSVSSFSQPPSNSDPGPSNRYPRIKRDFDDNNNAEMTNANVSNTNNIRVRRYPTYDYRYYLETLIIITRDVADMFEGAYGANNYIEWIVRYCINHFNAVDMIFQLQQSALPVRINIAKIVIANKIVPLQFTSFEQLRQYLHIHEHAYPKDSFDHVFMITSLPITRVSSVVPALTQYDRDMYRARENGQFYNAVPITMIGYVTDYAVSVQEIARTFSMGIDSEIGYNNRELCSSIMQVGGAKCDVCLKWNDNSKMQFSEFFRNNRNRCFLLNEPRSLQPPGPRLCVSPLRQCKCYGYSSYIRSSNGVVKSAIPPSLCSAHLQCEKIGGCSYEYTIPPLDGTRCGLRAACWDGKCVMLPSGSGRN